MAEEQNFQERSHEATPRRKQKARAEGQVPRSKDLNNAMLLLVGSIALILCIEHASQTFSEMMQNTLSPGADTLLDFHKIIQLLRASVMKIVFATLPFFIIIFILAFAGPLLLGGWTFNMKSAAVKVSRINPLSGLKRMFSPKSLLELIKAALKFFVITAVSVFFIYKHLPQLMTLSLHPISTSMNESFSLLSTVILSLTSTLILFSLIDVPYQIWDHNKKLKMTQQELKEESKDSEGNPEIKRRLRQQQHAVSQRRMMQEVPKADVIITNPTHFAVAIKYDANQANAPRVVAKGGDLIAEQIRHIAHANRVPIVSAPPLARSLYHNTPLFHEIPEGLYVAVAKVLAYIFQLKRYQVGMAERPELEHTWEIPAELKRD